ncbi:G5 and 3D domain-containing protein [Candidatus Ruminimicrobiellum ovillum]|uniref:G5 and 3D domain-containing protein n=1 Tax=Candidatus Ruminimicrobiellum ovillum TaxID=1947927 RepID=UPI00355A3586
MKNIEIKKFVRLLYIPIIILLITFILNTNSILSKKSCIMVDGKIILIQYDKNKILKDILKDNNISLNENDIVYYDLNKPIKPNAQIKIVRVDKVKSKVASKSDFRPTWHKIYNSNLRKVELQKGIVKYTDSDITQVFHDSKLESIVYDKQLSYSISFYRLLLLDKNNNVEKIYDLSKAKRMKMVATAYYPGDPLAWKDGTITFLGQKMQRGIVAVDPKVIPLRTRLYISGYGYGYAGDTGSAIKGDRIDLGVNNAEEEKSWMFREVTVYILEKSNTW